MTQQPEADDKGDGAEQDVAAPGIRTCRADHPRGGKAEPGCATGMDELFTRWLSLDPKDATPMEMRTGLARLESAFPAFSFAICRGWGGPRFEAWRDTTRGGLYAIITDDPRELWLELNMAPR
jgi:hypothetical protein